MKKSFIKFSISTIAIAICICFSSCLHEPKVSPDPLAARWNIDSVLNYSTNTFSGEGVKETKKSIGFYDFSKIKFIHRYVSTTLGSTQLLDDTLSCLFKNSGILIIGYKLQNFKIDSTRADTFIVKNLTDKNLKLNRTSNDGSGIFPSIFFSK